MSKSHEHSSQNVEAELSRRNLYHTAGRQAGGARLLGLPKFVGGWARRSNGSKGSFIGADQHVAIQDTGGVLVQEKGPLDPKAP